MRDAFIDDALIAALENVPALAVRPGEPMARHTVLRVGGPADLWLVAETEAAAQAALTICKEAGQKVRFWDAPSRIVRDGGLSGVWMRMGGVAMGIAPAGDGALRVGALYPVAALGGRARREGWSSLVSLVTRPGSALAAWRAGLLRDCVVEVRAFRGARPVDMAPEKVSERHLVVSLVLHPSRADGPHLDLPLPGTVLADHRRVSAASLVDEAGQCGVRLRQVRIGRLEPSTLINLGGASARDIELIIRLIRDRVKMVSGVELEPISRPIGRA